MLEVIESIFNCFFDNTNACIFFSIQLLGCSMGLLEGIDPNPDNFVTAGIIHTCGGQIGYLLRLEPNLQSQVAIYFYYYYF